MSLYQQSFDSSALLADHINDQAIGKNEIQRIIVVDGRWYLFWWA